MPQIYGNFSKAGFEIFATDPVTNLFVGRLYFNTTTNSLMVYTGSSWLSVASGGATPSEFTKFVGTGQAYTVLAGAIISAVPGDSILVLNSTTESSGPLLINKSDISITCRPGAVIGISGGATTEITISQPRVRLNNFSTSINATAACSALVTLTSAALDCWVEMAIEKLDSNAITFAAIAAAAGGGARNIGKFVVKNTGAASIAALLNDAGNANDLTVIGG